MKEVTGDLVALAKKGQFDVIIHGCNCFHTMGGGIARQIRSEYPEAYKADLGTNRGDRGKLGTFTDVLTQDSFVIVNAYTQFHYGEAPEAADGVLADYDAIHSVFLRIKELYGGKGVRFGIPLIGAGLARGDWNKISKIIETVMQGEDITLVRFDGGR